MSLISDNLSRITDEIHAGCKRTGRDPATVSLMAVSKNHPAESVLEAMAAGHKLFGENRIQEAKEKFGSITGEYELHMIGHLQRNKVQDAVSLCSCIQSVDALRTLEKISRISSETWNNVDVLLEVNTSQEATKNGVLGLEELEALIHEGMKMSGIRIRGLMTMAPFTEDRDKIRTSFVSLRKLFEEIGSRGLFPAWDTLSMGMSSDFDIAIEEGSTLVRIGTAIFGGRT